MKNDILEIIESDQSNLLILGKAGVGKSTLIKTLKSKLAQKCIVVCPTGIAAQNVDGQTIHSFFNIPSRLNLKFSEINSSGQKLGNQLSTELKELNTIIIDEISMVNQFILESISEILKVAKNNSAPFGNIRIILIGAFGAVQLSKLQCTFESLSQLNRQTPCFCRKY
jgi:DNA replication protein DnaC